jgi:hypothetical protein
MREQPRNLSVPESATSLVLGAALLFGIALSLSPPAAALQKEPPKAAGQPSPNPTFNDTEALTILDNLQAALQSYNRKKFLADFDPGKMPNFPAFRNQINSLFERYDSFTVTYQLEQTAMENSSGVILADFGLDATSNSDDTLDLRRHTQIRIVVAWNGKEWKIVDLSPRAVFQ